METYSSVIFLRCNFCEVYNKVCIRSPKSFKCFKYIKRGGPYKGDSLTHEEWEHLRKEEERLEREEEVIIKSERQIIEKVYRKAEEVY